MEHKICALSTKVHKYDAFHKGKICVDTQKYVKFSSFTSVERALATSGVSICNKFCDCRVTAKQRDDNKGDIHDLEPVTSFSEDHDVYKTVITFFYIHSISGCNEQHILTLELELICLKCKFSVTDFFERKIPAHRY
jgi:hypothetical protein